MSYFQTMMTIVRRNSMTTKTTKELTSGQWYGGNIPRERPILTDATVYKKTMSGDGYVAILPDGSVEFVKSLALRGLIPVDVELSVTK